MAANSYPKEVWFFHGANASPMSFNYIKSALERDTEYDDYNLRDFTYDCADNLPALVKLIAEQVSASDKEIYLVGHSLGGVLVTAASQRLHLHNMPHKVKGVFTMSSPFGGSESADYLRWLYPNYHLFKNISTQNKMITDLRSVGAVIPTTSLVSTSGNNPLFPNSNDGVVTVKSQRALPNATYIEMPCNHFEILLSEEALTHLKLFLKK